MDKTNCPAFTATTVQLIANNVIMKVRFQNTMIPFWLITKRKIYNFIKEAAKLRASASLSKYSSSDGCSMNGT